MYCLEILLKAKFKADTELVGGLRHPGVEGGGGDGLTDAGVERGGDANTDIK